MNRNEHSVQNKILWLSIVQGWAILLVVIGHVNGFTYSGNQSNEMYPMSELIHTLCYAFHMPLFMFVSGGLLYFTRLQKGWDTPSLYIDKLKRLMIPYLFFTVVTFVLKGFLSSYTKRGVDTTPAGLLQAIVDPANGPLGEMWFIGTLMWLMLMYPLYRVAMKWQWTELILLAVTLLPLIFSNDFHIKGWFNINSVPRFAFFFFGGMLFFKYRLHSWFENRLWPAIVLTIIFPILPILGFKDHLFTPSVGILMSLAWGIWIADRCPKIFSSFRDHSFQIFLVGIFPQMFVELFLWKRLHHEWLQIPYYILSCVLALAFAVAVSRMASRIKTPWLRWCFGLK